MVARKSQPVRIIHGALDETANHEIVLRGVIDPASLPHLCVDDYQREALPLSSLSSIIDALKEEETLPDVELGMRGENFGTEKGGVVVLLDPVYIVDGLQRINAAQHFLATNPKASVRLGATVHFGTTKEWERDRFRILNTLRSKVSPNVLLRNERENSKAVLMLFGLSTADKNFVLHDRVSWSQRMKRGELLSALMLAKTTGMLHSHKAATRGTSIADLVPGLDKAVDTFGIQNMRGNIRAFFELVDECWGIRRVQYREGASYMKGTFLTVLAKILSNHHDFWQQDADERKLFVEASLRRKLALFPTNDPTVVNLASSGGKARESLYLLMRDHINSGKRTKRLTSRVADIGISDEDEMDEGNGDCAAA